MAEVQKLDHPPIKEAVFRIYVDEMSASQLRRVSRLEEEIDGEWGRTTDHSAFRLGTEGLSVESTPPEERGFRVLIPSKATPEHVFEFDRRSFNYHRLPHYQHFGGCLDGMLPKWQGYVEAVKPGMVRGLGVRFLNSIEIAERFEYEDYFRIPLPFVGGWNDGRQSRIRDVRSRIAYEPDEQTEVVVSQHLERREDGGSEVVLDLEVTRRVSLHSDDLEGLKAAFFELRDQKNLVFFESLTEKALNLYDPVR